MRTRFLRWKDKEVRENVTVNNKNITLNGKNITVKVTQMQKEKKGDCRVKPGNDREANHLMISWLCCVRDGSVHATERSEVRRLERYLNPEQPDRRKLKFEADTPEKCFMEF